MDNSIQEKNRDWLITQHLALQAKVEKLEKVIEIIKTESCPPPFISNCPSKYKPDKTTCAQCWRDWQGHSTALEVTDG